MRLTLPRLHPLDTAIILVYLAAVIAAGMWFGRKQQTTRQYFLAGHGVPWWAIAASIVATETSTITFISVPGIAWAAGGDFRGRQAGARAEVTADRQHRQSPRHPR